MQLQHDDDDDDDDNKNNNNNSNNNNNNNNNNKKDLMLSVAFHLQNCIPKDEVPDWMTSGWAVLLLKDRSKGNKVSNYRPITCVLLLWKLLTGIVGDEIYLHLEDNDLLLEEWKYCHRSSRGAKGQLLIYKKVVKNCWRKKVELSFVWIDY